MLRSVATSAFPLAGTFVATALERSYPAEKGEAREGKTAFAESFLTRRRGVSTETSPFLLVAVCDSAWAILRTRLWRRRENGVVVYGRLAFKYSKFQQRVMMEFSSSSFGSSPSSISSHEYDYFSSSSEEDNHWLLDVLAGIFLCFLVYKATAKLSSLLFNRYYGQLCRATKIEWNNRGFSTLHALLVSFTSFYLLVISDLFSEDSHEDLIVNRSSNLSNTVLGISIGYFITDLAMIFWYFPALGGLQYVLHHGLSMFSITLSLLSGQVQIYVLMILLSEITTPFVNLRWYLNAAGLKSSKLYIANGIAMFLVWLVARILLFIYFFYHMWTHFDEVEEVLPLSFYTLLVVPPVLAMMNIFWFWKIVKGVVKAVSLLQKQS
ncbi:unnamed protein product [Lupinus luteus]|uniref:TLC domain-containing protein n=1 Tax=Lupinus luteus TaxID=3873 RepID=A0AAV1X2U3_LUPLU